MTQDTGGQMGSKELLYQISGQLGGIEVDVGNIKEDMTEVKNDLKTKACKDDVKEIFKRLHKVRGALDKHLTDYHDTEKNIGKAVLRLFNFISRRKQ